MQEFIRKRGVTVCPGMGTKELADHNARAFREGADKASQEARMRYRNRWKRTA